MARDGPGLFDGGPVYDAAAAALMRRHCGLGRREAHGLVSHYRPTAAQIRTLVANIAARDRAYRDGKARRKVMSRAGFVQDALKRGDLMLDDRVLEYRRQGRERARAALARRRARQAKAVEATRHVAACADDAALWASLSDERRIELRARAMERDEYAAARTFLDRQPLDSTAIRSVILKEARR